MYRKIFKISLLASLITVSLISNAQQLTNINKPIKNVPNMAPSSVPKTQFQSSTVPWVTGGGGGTPIVTTGPGVGACTARTVTWGNGACSGNIGNGTQMQNSSVVNTKAEATGTGNFSCVNGNWVRAAGSTCEPTVRTCQLFDIHGGYLSKSGETTTVLPYGTTTTATVTYTPAYTGTNTYLYKTSIPHSENTVRSVMCTPGTPAQMEAAYITMRNTLGKGIWARTYDSSQGYGVNSGYGYYLCTMAVTPTGCGSYSATGTINSNGSHTLTCTYTSANCSGSDGA